MRARAWVILAALSCSSCERPPASGGSANVGTNAPGANVEVGEESGPPPLLASESLPAGLQPLSKTELAVLEVECGRLMAQIQAPAETMPAGPDAMFAMLEVAARLRPGESRTDCLDLAERDIKNRLAGMLEREAMRTLQWLAGKLHQRLSRGDDLCPSAAPVPASIDALRSGASVSRSEWERAGWETNGEACLDSDWRELAKRFQVEVRTDATRRTSKLIARGFLVIDGDPSELFVTVTANDHGPEVSDVMRVGGVPK